MRRIHALLINGMSQSNITITPPMGLYKLQHYLEPSFGCDVLAPDLGDEEEFLHKARAGTYDITYKCNWQALGLYFGNLLHWAFYAMLFWLQAVTGHFVHCQGMQGNVRTAPGVGSRGKVIRIGFTSYFENCDLD